MHIISKEIEGDFGHRVWTQNLDEEFACTTSCKCKALHGHRFKIVPELYNEDGLQADGMVTDFSHLAAFKKWVDAVMDHKLLMDINDPALYTLFPKVIVSSDANRNDSTKYRKYELPDMVDGNAPLHELELYQGLTIVHFVPTAENLCKWLAINMLPQFLPKGVRVKSLTFYETPKSFARWEN